MTRGYERLVKCEGQTGVGELTANFCRILPFSFPWRSLRTLASVSWRRSGEKVRSKSVGRPSFTRESGMANVSFMVMTLTLFALVPLLLLPRDAAVGGLLPDIPKAIPHGLVSP